MTESASTFCYAHPGRETTLRCKRCERYICASCASRTPTGYLCKDCVRQHQKTFDTALLQDYLLGLLVTSALSLLASGLLAIASTFIGFYMFFISVAVAGGAGVYMANIALRVTGKRRSRPLFITCAAGVVIGALPVALSLLFTFNMYALIALGIYIFVATPTVYARLAGIQL